MIFGVFARIYLFMNKNIFLLLCMILLDLFEFSHCLLNLKHNLFHKNLLILSNLLILLNDNLIQK